MLAYDHDEEGALGGAQLISAETDPDLQREQDIFLFINENFAAPMLGVGMPRMTGRFC